MEGFAYYEYEVGRENYKPETKKLVWNVFHYSHKTHKIEPINLFDYNWVFLRDGLLYAKKHYKDDFNKFAEHIRLSLQHEYWSRCEYETIITGIFDDSGGYKMDVYTQVMLNWDRFIDYVWNNKKLITKKRLGL